MQSKVSMVVPCYNKERYIPDFLQSVYDQTWENIELILVNDGSTDQTRNHIAQWEQLLIARGFSVLIIDQENEGLPAAVYAGMLRATGDYVCTVDCDDELHPEYASVMACFLDKNPAYMWCVCNYVEYMKPEKERQILHVPHDMTDQYSGNIGEQFLLGLIPDMVWIYLVRMSYLKQCRMMDCFYTKLRQTQEPQYVLPLANGQGKLKYINTVLYYYHRNPEQMSIRKTLQAYKVYLTQYQKITRETLRHLHNPRYELAMKLAVVKNFLPLEIAQHNWEGAKRVMEEFLCLINTSFHPSPNIQYSEAIWSTWEQIYIATEYAFLRGEDTLKTAKN